MIIVRRTPRWGCTSGFSSAGELSGFGAGNVWHWDIKYINEPAAGMPWGPQLLHTTTKSCRPAKCCKPPRQPCWGAEDCGGLWLGQHQLTQSIAGTWGKCFGRGGMDRPVPAAALVCRWWAGAGAGRQCQYHGARSRQAMLCHRAANKRPLSSPNCSPWVTCCSVCDATGNVVGHAMSSTRPFEACVCPQSQGCITEEAQGHQGTAEELLPQHCQHDHLKKIPHNGHF